MPQVPTPPQAEGKNNLLFPSVVSNVSPDSTVSSFSPFTVMVTGPEGDSLDLAKSKTPTKVMMSTKKTIMVIKTVVPILQCVYLDYNSIPIKLMNAMPISPVIIKVIPNPRSGPGTCE